MKRILFFGDSITKAGALKGGYIDLIRQAVYNKNKQKDFELTSAGIDGNKVYDLYLRMDTDVLNKNPAIVVVYIGINDIWHKTSGTGTDIEKYEIFYRAIIKKLQEKNINIILCTASVIGEKQKANAQDADLEAYLAIIRKLAVEYNCLLADLRAAFMNYEIQHNTGNKELGILTTDGVHLNDRGNQLVAEEMMKVLAL
jgi:lysophospholipase L1-like esterase